MMFCVTQLWAGAAEAQDAPERVQVMPVFVVPVGEAPPSDDQRTRLERHLVWAQQRFAEMLDGSTFAIEPGGSRVYRAQRDMDFYRNAEHYAFPVIVDELLSHFGRSRADCPWVFVTVFVNPAEDYPRGAGAPLRGGDDPGGGALVVSTTGLDHTPNFQSTLRHELGHAFGLPHVDHYGHDMAQSRSMMSYNQAHHTRGFEDSATPGVLLPRERNALLNRARIFRPTVRPPRITTSAGALYGSRASNVWGQPVVANRGPGVTFDPNRMWHSAETPHGWVHLDLEFSAPAELSGLSIHTEHSGRYHRADVVYVESLDGDQRRRIASQWLHEADSQIRFTRTRARRIRVWLRAEDARMVVVRGLGVQR
jgi:hypothetical protein